MGNVGTAGSGMGVGTERRSKKATLWSFLALLVLRQTNPKVANRLHLLLFTVESPFHDARTACPWHGVCCNFFTYYKL